jgi:hypothetical protein
MRAFQSYGFIDLMIFHQKPTVFVGGFLLTRHEQLKV